jgi:hypothetical protein
METVIVPPHAGSRRMTAPARHLIARGPCMPLSIA